MFKRGALTMAVVVCTGAAAAAQSADPMITAIKRQNDLFKGSIAKAAEKMSEPDYAFKPTPEVRSFGELVGHVANANYMICSTVAGEKSPSTSNIEKTATTKAALVKALNDAFAYCDGVYAKLTPEAAVQEVKLFGNMQPRLGALSFNNAHNMEHYGNMVTYMRMKNLVPPTSESR